MLSATKLNHPGAGSVLAGSVLAGAGLSASVTVAVMGLDALALILCAAATTAAVGLVARRRLGGVTGDVMGAAVELSATASLVLAVALAG